MQAAAWLRQLSGRRPAAPAAPRILVVGSPNVGKSALFGRLTGRYATVSNYPGTTVEVSRGRTKLIPGGAEVIDTPGLYSLLPITEEERVARAALVAESPAAVVHVVDAKNLERMVGLTIQLVEAGLPVVLALNMWDEAAELGIRINVQRLAEALGVPVVATVATEGAGLSLLVERIAEARAPRKGVRVDYGPVLEGAVARIARLLGRGPGLSSRARALLLLQGDPDEPLCVERDLGPDVAARIRRIIDDAARASGHSPAYLVAMARKGCADEILSRAVEFPSDQRRGLRETLSRLTMNPLTGLPLLALVLYFGLYKFVGDLGAGTLVDWLETAFEQYVNPPVNAAAEWLIPWAWLRDLVGGDFGIITLGIRYAVAIVLPIVGTFFIAFSILEDSGYLPRLAMLMDRVFKKIGLNGRAVIPMVLGLGCATMATMVTRTLESKRERLIATLLLALAVPCSAQMGVILGLVAGHPAALAVWAGVVLSIFLVVGRAAARVMPGDPPQFYMELPPLRLPRPRNILLKTYTRMVWYFKEILPLFVLASVLIWAGRLTGLFDLAIWAIEPVVRLIGLPEEAAVAFLFGFFRRDYGAAGLFDIHRQGLLTGNQLAVAAITLTLFLPCIAQFLIMKKEQGLRVTLLVSGFVLAVALATGYATHLALTLTGVEL
ncbi:MAG: ferrous iron transport protein B [Planctomycetes bacterium]|nr:ferrous iron transport protein B [Planctomycetota bacterium]